MSQDFSAFGVLEQSGEAEAPPDFSAFGTVDETPPEFTPDKPGIVDDFQGVGRALKRGAYRARQAANTVFLTDALEMRRRVDAIEQEFSAWEKENAGKPDPTGRLATIREGFTRHLAGAKSQAETLERMAGTPAESGAAITRDQAEIAKLPPSEAMHEFQTGNWAGALAKNPVEVSTSLMAESLPLSVPGMVAGSMVAGPAGTAAGAGLGSFAAEYSTAILDSLQKAGIDITKPDWQKTVTEQQMAAATQYAVKRGVPVAILDGLSGGLAGRFAGPAMGKGARAVLGAIGKETAVQAGTGMTGEALAQYNTGEPFSVRDIVAEGIAELPGGAVEAGKNILESKPKATAQQTQPQPKAQEGTPENPIEWKDENYLKIPESKPVEVTPTLANDLEASIKGNQLAPEPTQPVPSAEPAAVAPEVPEPAGEPAVAKRPKFDDKAPNPAESRVSSLAAEDQVHEALTLGELPLGEWTEEQRQLAEALRKSATLKQTDREAWRMIFSRATNEDRHLEGLKPKLFLTTDSTRNWQILAKGEVAQPKTTVLPETDKKPAPEPDEIPMQWEAPAKPEAELTPAPQGETVQKPVETITGPDEREGSAMPAEVGGSPTPQASPSKPQPRKRTVPQYSSSDTDILDSVMEHVGVSQSIKAHTSKGALPVHYESPDYALFRKTAWGRRLLSAKGKASPDQVVAALIASRQVPDDFNVEDLWSALHRATQNRKAARSGQSVEDKHAEKQIKAEEDFKKHGVRKSAKAQGAIAVTDLSVGDKFTVDGARFQVVAFHEDENGEVESVELEDGQRFGTQRIDGEQYLRPDAGSYQSAGDNVPFSLAPKPNTSGTTLDFDKKLSEQPEAVRKAIEKWAQWDSFWQGDGKGFFRYLTDELGSHQEAEDHLLSEGITSVSHNGRSVDLAQSTEGLASLWDRLDGQSKTSPGKSISIDVLREHAERLNFNLPGALPTKVVQSISDLPKSLQDRIAKDNHTGVRGVMVRGRTVYMIADHITDEVDAIRTWLHEQVGHHGVLIVAGDQMPDIVRAITKRLKDPAYGDIRSDIVELYDLDLNNPDDAKTAAEEYIARMAEEADFDPSLWKQVVSWFKKAWRKLTGGDISEDEIRALIRRAYRQLQTQQTNESNLSSVQRRELPKASEGAAGAPKFSKKPKPNTFIQQQDELLGKLAAARRAGDTKEVERLRTEVETLEKAQFGQSVKRKTNDLLDEEDMAPAPVASPGRKAAVRMVQGATTNPTVDAATWWTQLKRWLRNFSTPLPELPLLGEGTDRFAAVRRWYRAVDSETELSREKAKRMVRDIIRPIQELGREVVDPNTVRKYQDITNKIHSEWVKGEARDSDLIDSLNAQLDELEPTIGKNPWHLFQNVILWRDLNYRTNVLKTEDGHDITPPAGMTKEEVAATSREAQEAVNESEHAEQIKEALKRHYAFVERMQKELEAHGEVIPDEMKNPDYFPHHILDGWTGKLAPVRATTEGPWRPYMQPITGTEKLHQSDYLAAMYKHASDVLANNAQVALVERDIQPYDIAKEHLAELEKQFEPDQAKRLLYDEKYLPAGYAVIRPSEHLRLSASYIIDRTTLSEKLGKAIAEDEDLLAQLKEFGADLEVSAEDIREALTVGEQVRWIVPQEVADVLAGIKKREDAASNPGFGTRLFKPLATVQKLWKMNTLFNPLNWPRYEYGNTMTDVIDKVWGLDPGIGKYMKQALREVREAANGNTSPEYDAALKEGVMQTVTASEAADLAKLEQFEEFLTDGEKFRNNWNKVWRFTTGLSAVRESTFRYAKFLADLDRIKNGERPVYGGAFHKDVEAQQTPEQKAGLISRKSFGDYADISVAGATFRKYVFPFWSWQEVNMKYHVNLFRNMVDMVKLGDILAAKHASRGAAVATTKAAVGIALRLALARIAVELWNQVGGKMAGLWDDDDDLEAQLSEADRRRLHIILGKDDKGRVRVVYVPNALADVMEWVGGNNFSRLFVDWASGDISLGRFAKDYAKQVPGDFANKIAQAVRPEAKFFYMMFSERDPFPDILNQRRIDRGDWYWMLGQAMDRDITLALRNQLDPYFYSPESAGDWWQRKILQVRRRDPERWAYFEIRDLAADFREEKTGKRYEGGGYMSADQKVLRNFRKAIYNADMENAQKFYEAALALGYTSTRFKASLRAQDPLADLNKEQAKEFEASLNLYEKRMLKLAKAYYGRMASGKGQEAELFPKKEGRPFTGRPEKLRELIESGRGR